MSDDKKSITNLLTMQEIATEMLKDNKLAQIIIEKYEFVPEQDENGMYDPKAVEKNMLAEAKLSGDLYNLAIGTGLVELGEDSLSKLHTQTRLNPKMQKYLEISDAELKQKILEEKKLRLPDIEIVSKEILSIDEPKKGFLKKLLSWMNVNLLKKNI